MTKNAAPGWYPSQNGNWGRGRSRSPEPDSPVIRAVAVRDPSDAGKEGWRKNAVPRVNNAQNRQPKPLAITAPPQSDQITAGGSPPEVPKKGLKIWVREQERFPSRIPTPQAGGRAHIQLELLPPW